MTRAGEKKQKGKRKKSEGGGGGGKVKEREQARLRQTAIILLVILSDRPETRALLKPLSKDEVKKKKASSLFSP